MKKLFLIQLFLKNGLIAIQFKTKVQIKRFTHMFYFWASFHKLYKEHVFIWFITLKCIFEFENNEKIVDPLNGNCQINEIGFWLFIPSTFSHSYLFSYLHKQVGVSSLPT